MEAINLWNEKRKDDEIFKVYRWEYKKRFGWIKAGRIEQDDFYAWSEKAREQKVSVIPGKSAYRSFRNGSGIHSCLLCGSKGFWYTGYTKQSPAFAA